MENSNMSVLACGFCLLLSGCSIANGTRERFNVTLGRGMSYGSVIATFTTRSILECVTQCSSESSCSSAVFEPVFKTCTTNTSPVDVNSVACSVIGCSGHSPVKYATKISGQAVNVTMKCPCLQDSDCQEPHTVCRDDHCLCIPGYSYHSNSRQCVNACASYGTTFQPDVGKVLVNHNNIALNNVTGQGICENMCIMEQSFVCKTFEYSPTLKACNLQNFTAADRPDLYSPLAQYMLHTRDCA